MVTLNQIKKKLLMLSTLKEKLEFLKKILDKIKNKELKEQIKKLIEQIEFIPVEKEKIPGTIPIQERAVIYEEPEKRTTTLETKLVGTPMPILPEEEKGVKYGGAEFRKYGLYEGIEEAGRELKAKELDLTSAKEQRIMDHQSEHFHLAEKEKLINTEKYIDSTKKYKEKK